MPACGRPGLQQGRDAGRGNPVRRGARACLRHDAPGSSWLHRRMERRNVPVAVSPRADNPDHGVSRCGRRGSRSSFDRLWRAAWRIRVSSRGGATPQYRRQPGREDAGAEGPRSPGEPEPGIMASASDVRTDGAPREGRRLGIRHRDIHDDLVGGGSPHRRNRRG